ncbi:IKI3 family-domain-containing protein [Hyaloraphidium curvatum]|nr:IKI3 family-domain-containing protein [Hyaloraphidium curvatum]
MQLLPDSSSLCLAFSDGDIFVIGLDRGAPASEDQVLWPFFIECVGSIEGGIAAMEWSPDKEVFAVATGKGSLLEMTKDFDVVVETELVGGSSGVGWHRGALNRFNLPEALVSVGWGKKETQFHGSEGKEAARRKITAVEQLVDGDSGTPRFSWRGDGNAFCALVPEQGKGRVLHLYTREAGLQYIGERVSHLGDAVAWRPQGNQITSYQLVNGSIDVIFFEPNGLRHGQFSLREPASTKVLSMCWNSDSTILAVELLRNDAKNCAVQLWASSNYHWYLKQEIRDIGSSATCFLWDPESATVLHVLSSDGVYTCIKLYWDTFRNTSIAASSQGTVAVVDGDHALLTPFASKNIPPPMYAWDVSLSAAARYLNLWGDGEHELLLALLCDSSLACYKCSGSSAPQPMWTTRLHVLPRLPHSSVRQACLIAEDVALLLSWNSDAARDELLLVKISNDGACLILADVALPKALAMRLYHHVTFGRTVLELADGSLYSCKDLEPHLSAMPSDCAICAGTINASSAHSRFLAIVALDSRGRLSLNEMTIAADATSFFCHSNFLIFTTISNRVDFVPLMAPGNVHRDAEATESKSPLEHVSRRIERGAFIVTALHGAQSLVLQMPRGNLETIAPRPLVLTTVKAHLDKMEYRDALVLCRRHRIDLNVLVDHNLDRFLANVDRFIRDVDTADYLNLFLSALTPADVTRTLYAALYPNSRSTTQEDEQSDKVNRICTSVGTALDQINPVKYEQAILVSLVKHMPPDYEGALRRILDIKGRPSKSGVYCSPAEEALRYAIFLSDVRSLFDVALGMYNFALALMVAQQSQMDPKEYLPFLHELRQHEGPYRKFAIDDHLRRYNKAIGNLAEAGPSHFEQLLGYMQEHSLYSTAASLFPRGGEEHKAVMRAFAASLLSQAKYDAAGMVLEQAALYEESVDAYSKGLCWNEALSAARRVPFDKERVAELGKDLADELIQEGRFSEAATVFREVLHDTAECVSMLVKSSSWSEAIRIATAGSEMDLLETVVYPAIRDELDTTIQELQDQRHKFDEMFARLGKVRTDRELQKGSLLARPLDLDDGAEPDKVDLMSDTASMKTATTASRSVNSKASRKSSKSRRKEERKRLSGKEGSPYEEEYLVVTLRSLVQSANNGCRGASLRRGCCPRELKLTDCLQAR